MFAIKLEEDKSLVVTVPATIYQHERNADTLIFLIPKYYDDVNLSDCTVLLRYILPNGVGKSEQLEIDPASHNRNYNRYHLKMSTALTETAGEIELWLSLIDLYDNLVIQSGTSFIEVVPAKDITDYLSSHDLNQLDRLNAQVTRLEKQKADNIVLTPEKLLQLTSKGAPIGDTVDIAKAMEEPDDDENNSTPPIDPGDVDPPDGGDSDDGENGEPGNGDDIIGNEGDGSGDGEGGTEGERGNSGGDET